MLSGPKRKWQVSNSSTAKFLWISREQLLNKAKLYVSSMLTLSDVKTCARKKKGNETVSDDFIVKLKADLHIV